MSPIGRLASIQQTLYFKNWASLTGSIEERYCQVVISKLVEQNYISRHIAHGSHVERKTRSRHWIRKQRRPLPPINGQISQCQLASGILVHKKKRFGAAITIRCTVPTCSENCISSWCNGRGNERPGREGRLPIGELGVRTNPRKNGTASADSTEIDLLQRSALVKDLRTFGPYKRIDRWTARNSNQW